MRGAMQSLLRLSLLVLLLVASGECAIHRNTRNGDISQQQPTVVEVDLQKEDLASILATARNGQSKNSRQERQAQPTTPPDGFGTTVVLENDPHTFALVHWSGQPRQRIFILTRKRDNQGYSTESFLYISYDYGKSFKNVTNKFPNDCVLEWYWISSNADILIFSDRINQRLYVTMDEGDTFHGYNISFIPQDRYAFRFQYSRVPNVIDYDAYVLGYDKTAQALWVTSNVNDSSSWYKLGDNVTRYAWRELNSTYETPTTVYFDLMTNDTAAQLYQVDFTGTTWTTETLFSPSLGYFSPGSFVLEYQYMFVQRNYTDIGVSISTEYQSPLWVSTYRNEFNLARFPLEVEERHYATVDASENQVFIAVYHDGESLNGTAITNMYLSEEAGLNYSLSLENIFSADERDWEDGYPTFDVYVVEALVGTYIANRESASGNGYSVISFDKGGEWRPIAPPTRDQSGLPIICNLPCSLHLHMYLDQDIGFQPVLSQDSAPGILMAMGNIGTQLTTSTSELRLYMSTNGGVSWAELSSGYKEFQLLDFGVYMAYTDKNKLTHNVWWSCTDGAEWTKYSYTDGSIYVVRMLTERGEKAQHATVFGYDPTQWPTHFEWLVIDLDFSTLNLTQCNDSDYYAWQPTDERSDQQCILGENFVYERRLPDHCCSIDALYDRPVNRSSCSCTSEDFECDFGFERVDLDGPCVPQPGFLYPPFTPTDCPEGETYSYTSGYRKISGDKCVAGNDTTFGPVVKDCPVPAPLGLSIYLSHDYYHVGPVDFTLGQTEGGILLTEYTWDFGDGAIKQLVGLDQASHVTHSYSTPKTYTVTMTATDAGGQGVAQKEVKVLDTMIALTLPTFPALVSTNVLMSVNITTQYGTQELGDLYYVWTVNNTAVRLGYNLASVLYAFPSVGNAVLAVDVSNTLDSLHMEVTIQVIEVLTMSLGISVNGNELVDNSDYVPLLLTVDLSVESSIGQFPPDTLFQWLIQALDRNETLYRNITPDSRIAVVFPSYGRYSILVAGTSGPVTFSVNQLVTATVAITDIDVRGLAPGYRINSNVTVTIGLLSSENLPYSGDVLVSAFLSTSADLLTRLLSLPLTVQEGQANVSIPFITEGTFSFMIVCQNMVSVVNATLPTFVADGSEYQYLRLIFNTSFLPSEYSSESWQMALQESITNTLLHDVALQLWQLEVEVGEEADTTSTDVLERKRQSSSSETIIVAHVYLLPNSLSDEDVSAMQQIASQLIEKGNNGELTFTVNGEDVNVTSADTGPSFIIIDNIEPGTDYLPLIIGLSVGSVVVVLILVVLVVVAVVYWKKKYRKLEVRYTRLRQGPMRFTFTAGGETLEEEDYHGSDEDTDNEDDGDDDAYKMSDKI